MTLATCEAPKRRRDDGRDFWRKDDPELDDKGKVVKGGMWEHQRTWWGMPNHIKLLVGGYGSGKSNILVKRAIATCLQNAPVPNLIVAPTYPMARDIIVETASELLDGKATLRPIRWHLNKSTFNLYIGHNGRLGRIFIRSGEDPKRLKGPNIGCAYIDEPFIQKQGVLDQCLARTRHPRAQITEIGMTGTPEELNWGFELAEGDMRESHDVGVVRAPTRMNRALPASYLKRLESAYTDKMRAAFLEGQFVNLATGLVYYAFDPAVNVVDLEAPKDAAWFAGWDFNVNPMAVVVGWHTADHVHFVEEFEEPNTDTDETGRKIMARYADRGLKECYPDPSGFARSTSAPAGRTDFSILQSIGFEINAPRGGYARRDRFNAVNVAMKSRVWTCSTACKKLRRYCATYVHEREHMTDHKAMGHLLDAMGYPCIWLFPVDRPKFVNVEA